jgi:hypothetical protein
MNHTTTTACATVPTSSTCRRGSRSRRGIAVRAALAAVALSAAVACGGGSAGTDAAPDTTTATAEGDAEVGGSEETTRTTVVDSGPYADYCNAVTSGFSKLSSGADDAKNLEQSRTLVKEMLEVAPDEVKADLQKLDTYFTNLKDPKGVRGANMPPDVKSIQDRPIEFALEHCDGFRKSMNMPTTTTR